MKPSQAIRPYLETGPFIAGAARVTLNDVEVAVLHRYPYGIEVVIDGLPAGGARGIKTALDTVACRLVERPTDPRSAAERQADADWLDYADTVASARPH